jgi:hypothetical protein
MRIRRILLPICGRAYGAGAESQANAESQSQADGDPSRPPEVGVLRPKTGRYFVAVAPIILML